MDRAASAMIRASATDSQLRLVLELETALLVVSAVPGQLR